MQLLSDLGYPTTSDRARRQLRKGTAAGSDVIVAESRDAGVLGLASLQVAYCFAEDERHCELTALVVRPDVRRQGLGRELVNAVERRATDAGCTSVHLRSGLQPERDAAHCFYEQLGYTGVPATDHVDYHKALVVPPPHLASRTERFASVAHVRR